MPVKIDKSQRLKFFKGNAKLGRDVWTFSLPAGHTCPGAKDCLAKVTENSSGQRSLADGPLAKFRCFAASQEVAFKSVYLSRHHNWKLILAARTADAIRDMILRDLSAKADVVRVHVSGDFFSAAYFDAWMQVARERPRTKFYGYTKSIHIVSAWKKANGELPDNYSLIASNGGKFDDRIKAEDMVTSTVVFHPKDAKKLKIDHDDKLAMSGKKDFALLLHGQGKSGSPHSAALKKMKEEGISFAYSRDKS